MTKLWKARSGLYRHKILQVNTHFAAFSEIYKIITLLHRAKPKIAAKNRQTFSQIFKIFTKIRYFSTIFVEFCTDFDEIFSEFRRIFCKMLKIIQISEFVCPSQNFRLM